MPDNKKVTSKVEKDKKKNVSSTVKKENTNKKSQSIKKEKVEIKTSTKKTESNKIKVTPTKKSISKKNNKELSESLVTKKKSSNNATAKTKQKKVPKFSTISNIKVDTKKEKAVFKSKDDDKKVSFLKKLTSVFRIKKDNKVKTVKTNKKVKGKVDSSKKVKEPVFTQKTKKWFIIIAVICLLILLFEGVYLIIHKMNIDKNTVYYDSLNSLVIDGTDIVSVGSSNFRYSKNYSYTNGLEKGKLIKYDKNGKVLFEKMYEKGINTTLSSIINVEDGYVVVGSGVFSKEEQQEGAREAFIIKYDKNGNIIWEKFYQVVTNTRFNKVIEVEDGYIAIGQSIYANMEMGNHTTGGGIIVKYDKDGNVIWYNNHGGMKSGNFNDIVKVNDDLYVVGKDATDSANIVKYDKDGKYVWHKNYSYTDGIGFTGISYLNNKLYVVGSKKILPDDITEDDNRDTTNTDALLVIYDLDGNKKKEKTFGGSNYERYNSIVNYGNNLYVVGHTSSKDAGFKIETDGELMTGIIVRYDKDGNILKKDILGGSNNDNLTDIITDGVCLYVSAYSNSNDGNIITSKNNGKDYFGKVIKLDFKFRTILIK